MSRDLDLVSQIIYLRDGEINPGDEAKAVRCDNKIADWKRDVVDHVDKTKDSSVLGEKPTKEEITSALFKLEGNFAGYWCEGKECACDRTHWVIHARESHCWDCMHDPCACRAPLFWDHQENAYYRVLLSSNSKSSTNVWMSQPVSDKAQMNFKRGEQKRKEEDEKEREEDECATNQQKAHNQGFCCHQHAKKMREEHEETRKGEKKQKIDGPNHCNHCEEDPCVFVQIESRLCKNDEIYYDHTDFAKAPVAYNSARRKRAFQYAAFILWEGVNYRKPHYTCVEDGVHSLFPPFDGKVMGFKNK